MEKPQRPSWLKLWRSFRPDQTAHIFKTSPDTELDYVLILDQIQDLPSAVSLSFPTPEKFNSEELRRILSSVTQIYEDGLKTRAKSKGIVLPPQDRTLWPIDFHTEYDLLEMIFLSGF